MQPIDYIVGATIALICLSLIIVLGIALLKGRKP